MIDVLAEISGVYAGFPSLVVTYNLKPSITSHSLSPTFTYKGMHVASEIKVTDKKKT